MKLIFTTSEDKKYIFTKDRHNKNMYSYKLDDYGWREILFDPKTECFKVRQHYAPKVYKDSEKIFDEFNIGHFECLPYLTDEGRKDLINFLIEAKDYEIIKNQKEITL